MSYQEAAGLPPAFRREREREGERGRERERVHYIPVGICYDDDELSDIHILT